MGNVTSVASLQAWTGMLYTYIRMYQGSVYVERTGRPAEKEGVKRMKRHRHRGQPYVSARGLITFTIEPITVGLLRIYHVYHHSPHKRMVSLLLHVTLHDC
jgi:amino acid transporter